MIHTPKGKTKQPAFAKDKTQGNFQGKKKKGHLSVMLQLVCFISSYCLPVAVIEIQIPGREGQNGP